ncbi:MAG: GYD domain-containing protein [Chloroflexota bacterium]
MPHYMYHVDYTADAWKAQVGHPKHRMEAITPMIEGLGGKVICAYYTFGKEDLIAIAELPGAHEAAAFAIAASAGGAVSNISTTVLMTMDEGFKAIQDAAKVGYAPPK